MIDIDKGRYWDLPWSLVSSCTRCGPGCRSCWALAMEKRFHKGIEGRVVTHSERLSIPLKRRKPTVYAVWNDLFHETVPVMFIEQVYEAMFAAKQHQYLILTKRPRRMRDVIKICHLPYVWHGLTVCNQREADEKIPVFLQVPGRKLLSIEPMLGPIDIIMALEEFQPLNPDLSRKKSPLDAVILGGETGPGARPMHPDWVRSIRDQCAAAGVPFCFKQGLKGKTNWTTGEVKAWGNEKIIDRMLDGETIAAPFYRHLDGRTYDDLPWVK